MEKLEVLIPTDFSVHADFGYILVEKIRNSFFERNLRIVPLSIFSHIRNYWNSSFTWPYWRILNYKG